MEMNQIIFDVREPDEFEVGHLRNAINFPLGSISVDSPQLREVKKDTAIIVYCQSGGRADAASNRLKKIGFSNVINGLNQSNIEENHI